MSNPDHIATLLLVFGLSGWFLTYLAALILWRATGRFYFDLGSITACVSWESLFLFCWLFLGERYRFQYASLALIGWISLSIPLLVSTFADSIHSERRVGSTAMQVGLVLAVNLSFYLVVLSEVDSLYYVGTITGYFCLVQISARQLHDAVRSKNIGWAPIVLIHFLRSCASCSVILWDIHVSPHKLLFAAGFSVILLLDVITICLSVWRPPSKKALISEEEGLSLERRGPFFRLATSAQIFGRRIKGGRISQRE